MNGGEPGFRCVRQGGFSDPAGTAVAAGAVFIHEFEIVLPKVEVSRYATWRRPTSSTAPVELAATDRPSRGCRAQSLYCAGQPCRIPYTWVSRQQTLAERRNKAIAPYDLAQRGPRNQSLVSVSHRRGALHPPPLVNNRKKTSVRGYGRTVTHVSAS